MRIAKVFFSLFFLLCRMHAQTPDQLIVPDAKLTKLADGFAFTEGPASDSEGNVFFTDQPNNKIYKWSTDGELSVFTDQSGRANGMYFDRNGYLIACSDMDNELWKFDENAKHTVILSSAKGNLFNGPNDVWVRPDGGMYLTDPLYKRKYWDRDPKMQREGEYVYYFDPASQKLITVDDGLVKPNGIVGHPKKNLLYVADIGDNKTYVYKIRKNGKLGKRKLFAEMGSDGMTIDTEGNIYLTGKGVTVFDAKGKKIGNIPVPEGWTSNVCFSGTDFKTLFITASESIYSIKMQVSGFRSN